MKQKEPSQDKTNTFSAFLSKAKENPLVSGILAQVKKIVFDFVFKKLQKTLGFATNPFAKLAIDWLLIPGLEGLGFLAFTLKRRRHMKKTGQEIKNATTKKEWLDANKKLF